MVQGCASGVGKSWIVAGLCRVYRRRGLSVAPFKAQNLSLNAAVTADGSEIGRSTAVQAGAAGVEPTADMNPFLIKPEAGGAPQLVVMGRVASRDEAARLFADRDERARVALDALDRLRAAHDLVVIEGAGSPAEPNLRDRDAVNMHVARAVDAPVLLVGDVSRGGVFAHLTGTLAWLPPEERALVRGLVINRLHGDPAMLGDAVRALEERAGVPVVGVLPALDDVALPDEDAARLHERPAATRAGDLDVAVVRLPHLSNHDDWQPLEREARVAVRYVDRPEDLARADLVVIPGTKDTRSDLAWLARTGLALAIQERAEAGGAVLGVCGGYQMLGRWVLDPIGVEGAPGMAEGLGLLPCETRFGREKTTRRRRVRVSDAARDAWFSMSSPRDADAAWDGYEIRSGTVHADDGAAPAFLDATDGAPEGVVRGAVMGTAVHGLFANAGARSGLLARFGLDAVAAPDGHEADYERLADALERHLDTARIDGWLGR